MSWALHHRCGRSHSWVGVHVHGRLVVVGGLHVCEQLVVVVGVMSFIVRASCRGHLSPFIFVGGCWWLWACTFGGDWWSLWACTFASGWGCCWGHVIHCAHIVTCAFVAIRVGGWLLVVVVGGCCGWLSLVVVVGVGGGRARLWFVVVL